MIAAHCEVRTFETVQRETTPAHFTSLHRSGSTDTIHILTLGTWNSIFTFPPLLHHQSTPTPPAHHPTATFSGPAIKDPAHHINWAAEIILGAAEGQLNSAADSRSALRQARLTRKRIRRVRANSTAQPATLIVRGDGAPFDLPASGPTSRPELLDNSCS
jgi:hypothetical protein